MSIGGRVNVEYAAKRLAEATADLKKAEEFQVTLARDKKLFNNQKVERDEILTRVSSNQKGDQRKAYNQLAENTTWFVNKSTDNSFNNAVRFDCEILWREYLANIRNLYNVRKKSERGLYQYTGFNDYAAGLRIELDSALVKIQLSENELANKLFTEVHSEIVGASQ